MCIYEPPVYVYFSVLLCWFAFFPPNCDAVKPAAGEKKRVYAFVLRVKTEKYVVVFFSILFSFLSSHSKCT